MGTVEFGHRNKISVHSEHEYSIFCDALVEQTKYIGGVRSIVVCGSLAKGTLVPGWSDLDIIYFFDTIKSATQAFLAVGKSIEENQKIYNIPVGVDLVSDQKFNQTLRVGGRPLAMTFEVAGCRKVYFGPDPFSKIVWGEKYRQQILQDADRLVAAELHNWRRWFITSEHLDPKDNLQRNVKTCLKLAKYQSDPNLVFPFSYNQCVESLEETEISDRTVEIYSMAVDVRENWLETIRNPRRVNLLNRIFSEELAGQAV